MNIFVLDEDAYIAAQLQCDKHVVKMIVESAQMLSTAHRLLDGIEEIRLSKLGRKQKYWFLPDAREDVLYKAVHMGHPCTVWTMESDANYRWHWEHFYALCKEYEHRYNKVHKTSSLLDILKKIPNNIPQKEMTQFKLAMGSNPECMHEDDPVRSYREFYQTKQSRFAMKWTNRPIPEWFEVRAA